MEAILFVELGGVMKSLITLMIIEFVGISRAILRSLEGLPRTCRYRSRVLRLHDVGVEVLLIDMMTVGALALRCVRIAFSWHHQPGRH